MIAGFKSPAKINLGLEILGKRPDGYHEIRTILHMIDVVDDLSVQFSDQMRFTCDDPALEGASNLAYRAARLWSEHLDLDHRPVHVDLVKRIPAAAGLGGASSNAAATLILAEELARFADRTGRHPYRPMTTVERQARLHGLAAQLGSDVPFFLGEAAALAHGRGELLEAVAPLQDALIVLATPDIAIENKTATMYRALDPQRDFTDGAILDEARDRLNAGNPLSSSHLYNAFARPLLTLHPELEHIAEIMGFYAGGLAGLSGAGPTWYALVDSAAARELSVALARKAPTARIVIGRPLPGPQHVRIDPGA